MFTFPLEFWWLRNLFENQLTNMPLAVRHKNIKIIILELKDSRGQRFTKREDLDKICHSFYKTFVNIRRYLKKPLRKYL